MAKEDYYLEIFQHSFHKFTLRKVKLLGKCTSDDGREYYRFLGKFEFEPPKQTFRLTEDDGDFLRWLKSLDVSESNCFSRKYVRKVKKGGETQKTSFQYVFDVVPKNIVDAEIDCVHGRVKLWVLGYGVF